MLFEFDVLIFQRPPQETITAVLPTAAPETVLAAPDGIKLFNKIVKQRRITHPDAVLAVCRRTIFTSEANAQLFRQKFRSNILIRRIA